MNREYSIGRPLTRYDRRRAQIAQGVSTLQSDCSSTAPDGAKEIGLAQRCLPMLRPPGIVYAWAKSWPAPEFGMVMRLFGFGSKKAGALTLRKRQMKYVRRKNLIATEAKEAIVAARPERQLDEQTMRHIRDYARDHLGHEIFAPWLETYATFRGQFVEGCIPGTYHGVFVVPHANSAIGPLSETYANRIFDPAMFPDLAMVFYGKLYTPDGRPLDSEQFKATIFSDHPYVYLKATGSSKGRGVQRITRDMFDRCIAASNGAVLQRPLEIHSDLTDVFPHAAATLRVTTINVAGVVKPVAAYLRFGRSDDEFVKSQSHVRVAIDLETGAFTEHACLADWTPTDHHPDTLVPFHGRTVPLFAEALESVCREHAKLPSTLYLGWDVAITASEGIRFFEVNFEHGDIKFSEACHGPIFEGLAWDQLHLKDRV